MEYKKLEPITKDEVENILKNSNDNFTLSETLFRMVNYIDDIDFIEKNILYISDKNIIQEKRVIDGILGFVIINRFLPLSFKKLLKLYENNSRVSGLSIDTQNHIKILVKNK